MSPKQYTTNTIFFGDRSENFQEVKKIFVGQSEVLEIEKHNIETDEVRAVISFCNKTSEQPKILMLSSFYWSHNVQNALLKVLEDTPPNTQIFLFGLSSNLFLPTVLSRLQKVTNKIGKKYFDLAKEIFAQSPETRLTNKKIVKCLSLKVEEFSLADNSMSTKKNREEHILLLQSLIEYILEKRSQNKIKLEKDLLEKINKVTNYIYDQGGSPHMFVEWLLLSTPTID